MLNRRHNNTVTHLSQAMRKIEAQERSLRFICEKLDEQVDRMDQQDEILRLFYNEYREMKKLNQREHLANIIRMREDMIKDLCSLNKKGYCEQDTIIHYIGIYAEMCTEILEDNGVEIISCNTGEEFNAEIEKPLESKLVQNSDSHNKIVEVYGDGYRWNGIMLKKINVVVGIYQQGREE